MSRMTRIRRAVALMVATAALVSVGLIGPTPAFATSGGSVNVPMLSSGTGWAVGSTGAQSLHSGAAPHVANASCNLRGCDGQDPYATGCDGSSSMIAATPNYPAAPGTILYWSSACHTNWAAVYSSVDFGGSYVDVDVQGTDPLAGSGKYNVDVNFNCYCYGTFVWGNMVYSPGCARAYGYSSLYGGMGSVYQPGCS
jgi:hypothetical protein